MRTQVCIIGAGPSGLLLSQLLHLKGIDTVVLERRSREHVLSRIRAGVLEWGTVELLRQAQVGARMDKEGIVHTGTKMAANNRSFRIDYLERVGKQVMIYGQTEVTADLYAARDQVDGVVIHDVSGVMPHDIDTETPFVTYFKDGAVHRVDCDYVAGCDGFHGVSRSRIPADVLTEYERIYPFGWLGVLSETPPADDELVYANHERGFALCSMRKKNLSRYYIQVATDDPVEKWTDEAFWDELRRRIPSDIADNLVTGPSIEKSVARLRSYVAEPMRWGRMFLVGDAAHIMPPTGAKGMNLAVSDVHYLYNGLVEHYGGDSEGLDKYSRRALARVWKSMRFSWSLTSLMHRFPDQSAFQQRIQEADLAYLESSVAAQTSIAENYVGLPY